MSKENKDKDRDAALAYLEAAMEAYGVGSIKFDDGEMFMFSRETIENIKQQMDEKNTDRAIVFVKTGQTLKEA